MEYLIGLAGLSGLIDIEDGAHRANPPKSM